MSLVEKEGGGWSFRVRGPTEHEREEKEIRITCPGGVETSRDIHNTASQQTWPMALKLSVKLKLRKIPSRPPPTLFLSLCKENEGGIIFVLVWLL